MTIHHDGKFKKWVSLFTIIGTGISFAAFKAIPAFMGFLGFYTGFLLCALLVLWVVSSISLVQYLRHSPKPQTSQKSLLFLIVAVIFPPLCMLGMVASAQYDVGFMLWKSQYMHVVQLAENDAILADPSGRVMLPVKFWALSQHGRIDLNKTGNLLTMTFYRYGWGPEWFGYIYSSTESPAFLPSFCRLFEQNTKGYWYTCVTP